MNFRDKRRQRSSGSAIDITALIDVVFLLLIFLLVTTQFKKDEKHAFVIEPPSSSAKQVTVSTNQTTIFVTPEGALYLMTVPGDSPVPTEPTQEAEKLTQEQLKTRLDELFQRRPDAPISIQGAGETNFQRIVDVMSVVQDLGFRRVSFPYTFSPDASPAP